MGERFLDWQLAQTPEESWAECQRHAAALGAVPAVAPPAVEKTKNTTRNGSAQTQTLLFGEPS